MSFDAPFTEPTSIAIVGGGISGLAAAYLLSATHRVTVFEAEARFGGHARTVMAGLNGDQPVDTGFIVFNYANYPHLTRMFHELNVPVERSDMTFGASVNNGAVEYGLKDLSAIFGQRRNLARPPFYGMVRDLLRFNATAEQVAVSDDTTIGELVDEMGLGRWFQDYYLMPICGAIWSTPPEEIRGFPAKSLLSFFRNHALLSATGQHQWWTVSGGSASYVTRLVAHLKTCGVALRSGCPIASIRRADGATFVTPTGGVEERFDHVIMAAHSDDSLKMLSDATPHERAALGNLTYQDNQVFLHRDARQMPKRKACWSSWVYKADQAGTETKLGVSYWMNRLQNIPESDPLFVTLNPAREIASEMIYDEVSFRHPVFDRAALKAQRALQDIQGQNNTWFAGAYTRHGFHEDGFNSAARIARALQADRILS